MIFIIKGNLMEKKYWIYAFKDENGIIFYIGKTCDITRRKRDHKRELKYGNLLPKYTKLRSIIEKGKSFDDCFCIIEECQDLNFADKREMYYISELRKIGYKLTNLTDGGDGGINSIPGIIDKLRKIHLGSKRSEITKNRIRDGKKGVSFSEEHKKNLSVARKKRKTTINTRLKCSKTSKGKINIKQYKLIDPNGVEYITKQGLTLFCEEHQLTPANMIKVLNGERNHHKGWKIEYLN